MSNGSCQKCPLITIDDNNTTTFSIYQTLKSSKSRFIVSWETNEIKKVTDHLFFKQQSLLTNKENL